jgi:hypothetical protein
VSTCILVVMNKFGESIILCMLTGNAIVDLFEINGIKADLVILMILFFEGFEKLQNVHLIVCSSQGRTVASNKQHQ